MIKVEPKFQSEIDRIQVALNWRESPLRLNTRDPITITSYHVDSNGLEEAIRSEFPDFGKIDIQPLDNAYAKWRIYVYTR